MVWVQKTPAQILIKSQLIYVKIKISSQSQHWKKNVSRKLFCYFKYCELFALQSLNPHEL